MCFECFGDEQVIWIVRYIIPFILFEIDNLCINLKYSKIKRVINSKKKNELKSRFKSLDRVYLFLNFIFFKLILQY